MAVIQGVRRPALPEAPDRYDQKTMQRTLRLIEQFMLEVHGRFQNDKPVTVEAWSGGAVTVVQDSSVASVSTIQTRARNGVYLIDGTLALSPGVGSQTATFTIAVDPDGASGYSTVATYTYRLKEPNVGTTFETFGFASTTLTKNGLVRVTGSAPLGDTDWSATFTPLRVRGM